MSWFSDWSSFELYYNSGESNTSGSSNFVNNGEDLFRLSDMLPLESQHNIAEEQNVVHEFHSNDLTFLDKPIYSRADDSIIAYDSNVEPLLSYNTSTYDNQWTSSVALTSSFEQAPPNQQEQILESGEVSDDFNTNDSDVSLVANNADDNQEMSAIDENESSATSVISKKQSKAEQKWSLNIQKKKQKHSVKEECHCRKECLTKIPHARRVVINENFNVLDSVSQKLYIRAQTSVIEEPTKRRSINYFLQNDEQQSVLVCCKFFMSTLGFNKDNNTVLRNALQDEFPPKDKRGNHPNASKLDETLLIDHIMSFHPQSSHHRREHAPERLYLPSDVSITKMHSLFNDSNPDKNCSYESYRKIVDRLNVSFTKLGHEKCETCEKFEQHMVNHSIQSAANNCSMCDDQKEHVRRYRASRSRYEEDKLLPYDPKHVIASADLEKVIMGPRMEQFKQVLFTKRISIFNETFAPLGSTTKRPVFACIWHQGTAGRKQEEIISSYHSFLLQYRDADRITIWCDNCSAQNKSWALYSFLTYIVSSTEINANSITLKYLEKGHTYMSADSFHHQVELSMKNREKGCVYDFRDFVDCVQTANNGKVICKEMNFFDFADWSDLHSIAKVNKHTPRPYVNAFSKVQFIRVKTTMFYANNLSESDDELIELDFIMNKHLPLRRPQPRTKASGVPNHIKPVILTELTPLMPPNRRQFWLNLLSQND